MEKEFWDNRYKNQETGWDIGEISTPIKTYFDQIEDKSLSILIPGCGFGHEATYLFENGFKNVTIIDVAEKALFEFKKRNPTFPVKQIVLGDFFEFEGQFDILVEQTLFCAINPKDRDKYVSTAYKLLKSKGILIGLLFDCEFQDGPPFGGSKAEYLERFSKKFNQISMEKCYNSIKPREGKEVFIKIVK
ncbi:MAG: methyltransferase domain-containing protein [Flavobacteriia bacterium]|jgi:SAM-dependent methyltransferase